MIRRDFGEIPRVKQSDYSRKCAPFQVYIRGTPIRPTNKRLRPQVAGRRARPNQTRRAFQARRNPAGLRPRHPFVIPSSLITGPTRNLPASLRGGGSLPPRELRSTATAAFAPALPTVSCVICRRKASFPPSNNLYPAGPFPFPCPGMDASLGSNCATALSAPLPPNSRTPTFVLEPCSAHCPARHLDFGLSRTPTLVPGPSRACRPARLWRNPASQTIIPEVWVIEIADCFRES